PSGEADSWRGVGSHLIRYRHDGGAGCSDTWLRRRSAPALLLVHRGVRPVDEALRGLARTAERYADAGAQRHLGIGAEEVGELADDPGRQRVDVLFPETLGHDHELVAPEAGDGVARADGRLDPAGD